MNFKSIVAILLFFATSAFAADWPQLRGPDFNGSTPETNLPTTWSQTENIEWCVDLPGPSSATPIVSGDHVFVSSTNPTNDTLLAMAFDRKSGELLWQHTVGEGIRKDTRSTFAAPTPATDGQVVIFFYGNGDMFAYDFDGKQLWKKNVGPFAFGWTFSTSPLLYGGKLYMQILQNRGASGQTESYILAMDPRTGSELWKQSRPSEAVGESLEAFNTPMPYELDGRKQLLVNGGDAVTGHDLDTGKELWRWETWNPKKEGHWRLVPSPVAGDGVVLLCAPKNSPVYALPTNKSGRLSDDDLLWVSHDERNVSSDVPTPAFYRGDFFILSKDRRALSRVEPKTGKIKWSTTLESRQALEASPLAADGKVYLLNFDGEATVVDSEDGKILSVIPMEAKENLGAELIRSSIIAAHGKIFIRTNTKLYCIGKS
jgi:outer membrane protein assembly factor BamB